MSKINLIQGICIALEGDDIDTDRIIPARFLKTVTFEGLGRNVFYDERFDEKGNKKNHPFNNKRYVGASILIVNKNFGCGSSREHAPQALKDFGIKAIIGESFAEIFANNCTSIGMPTVVLPYDEIKNLMMFVKEEPNAEIMLNLENKKIVYGDFEAEFKQNESYNKALRQGLWDSTGILLENKEKIIKLENNLPYGFR